MANAQFRLPIGAKSQVTIPKKCMGLLALSEGDELLLEVEGDYAILHPMVSVPRHELPKGLWNKFAARRGAKSTDIPLKTLLDKIGYRAPRAGKRRPETARKNAARAKSSGAPDAKRRAPGRLDAADSQLEEKD